MAVSGMDAPAETAPALEFDGAAPSDSWVELRGEALTAAEVSKWVVEPHCGAVVTFAGTARDHSAGRSGVFALEYEAYDEYALPMARAIVREARARWPEARRIALLHRTGLVRLTEPAVVVAVAAPHRDAAFEAARYVIDEVKARLPLWKMERCENGSTWVEGCGTAQAPNSAGVRALPS